MLTHAAWWLKFVIGESMQHLAALRILRAVLGVPTLARADTTAPVIGTTVDFAYGNLPTFPVVTPIMPSGFDDQSIQGLPNSCPHAALELPGCTA